MALTKWRTPALRGDQEAVDGPSAVRRGSYPQPMFPA